MQNRHLSIDTNKQSGGRKHLRDKHQQQESRTSAELITSDVVASRNAGKQTKDHCAQRDDDGISEVHSKGQLLEYLDEVTPLVFGR